MIQDIGELFDANFERIYRFFYYKTLNKSEAEDLTSETFFQMVDKVKKGQSIDNPTKYIFGIARHVFVNFLRKKYQILFVPLEEEHVLIAETEEFSKDKGKFEKYVQKLISKLPEKQRAILELRLIQKKEFKEVCAILKKDENYVKTTQKRGIQSLKKLIARTPFAT